MRWIAISVLFVGLGLAGFAAVQAQAMIERIQAENTVVQEVPTVRVVAFARDLPRGYRVTAEDLRYVEVVEGPLVVRGYGEAAIGMWTTRPVSAGAPTAEDALSATEVALEPRYVSVRRGTETAWVCVEFCPRGPVQ